MKDEERAHRDTHFQEELESLKTSVARFTSLLRAKTLVKVLITIVSPLIRLRQQLSLKKKERTWSRASTQSNIYVVSDTNIGGNVVVFKKFRVSEFIKYTGTECLYTHLRSYCSKKAKVIHDEKLVIHSFQYSLTGSALSWYMTLDNTRIKK